MASALYLTYLQFSCCHYSPELIVAESNSGRDWRQKMGGPGDATQAPGSPDNGNHSEEASVAVKQLAATVGLLIIVNRHKCINVMSLLQDSPGQGA